MAECEFCRGMRDRSVPVEPGDTLCRFHRKFAGKESLVQGVLPGFGDDWKKRVEALPDPGRPRPIDRDREPWWQR